MTLSQFWTFSIFQIDWMTELQYFNKFFLWRSSGLAALRVDKDKVGRLMDKIGEQRRVSLFISIAKSDLGPLASSNIDICTIILSNLQYLKYHRGKLTKEVLT